MEKLNPKKIRLKAAVPAAVLTLAAVLALGGARSAAAAEEDVERTAAAEEEADRTAAVPEGLSYEVKFLLDPEQVLDGEHHLKKEWEQAFGITEEFVPYEVMYLETPEQDFRQEGWFNRFRRKSGKKKVERTFKKRYPVADGDIAAAYETAKKDGFLIPDKDAGKEAGKEAGKDAADGFEAQIDWGYDQMTLSFSCENSEKTEGSDSLASFSAEEARAFLKKGMPEKEADWKQKGWGLLMTDRAEAVGPVRFLREKGTLEDRVITVEIWPAMEADRNGPGFTVELSFKAEDFPDARDGRIKLTELLDEKGILLHEDSLKTGMILDAGLSR